MRKDLRTNSWTGKKRRGHSDFCTVLMGAYLSCRQLLVGVISSCLSDLRYFVCLPSKSSDALCSIARLLGECRASVMPSLNANCLPLTYAVASLGGETFIGRNEDGGRGGVQRDRTQSESMYTVVNMSSLDHTAHKTACQSCLSSWYQAKDRSPSTRDPHSSRWSVARDTKCSIIPLHQREKLNTS
jgi:hypothetical protein